MSRTSGSASKPDRFELAISRRSSLVQTDMQRVRLVCPRRRHRQSHIVAGRPTVSRRFEVALRSANVVVPHRDPVAPPQLPADAPVALLAEPVEVASWRSAPGRTSPGPSVTASIAICARPGLPSSRSPIFTNHWSDRYGSIGVLLRSLYFSGITRSSLPSKRPSASMSVDHGLAGLVAVQARRTCRRSR